MDEIDRELKQIQLQRERLALKRELERSEWKANTIGIAGRGLSYGGDVSRAVVGGIAAFVKRGWKLTLVTAVFGASVYGGLMWRESFLQAELDAARTKYYTEREKFVTLKCADDICNRRNLNSSEESACLNSHFLKESCEGKARLTFSDLNGAAPSR